MTPGFFMAAILAALGALLLGARALQARGWIAAETARKLVHLGMGVISLFVPWIFTSAWLVWLIALLCGTALAAVRLVPGAAAQFGGALYSVGRFSLGEIYYPLGVALAFTLARGDRAAFCGAVSVLGFADSAGAIVGARWGRRRYTVRGHSKSIEGSGAVFLTSILCATLALIILGGESWGSASLGGLVIGAAATVIEAIAGMGLDNLLLPVVVVGMMKMWSNDSADFHRVRLGREVAVVIAFTVIAIAAGIFVSRRGAEAQRNPK
jgi:phytol kinase